VDNAKTDLGEMGGVWLRIGTSGELESAEMNI
jgi:hypothetical protein